MEQKPRWLSFDPTIHAGHIIILCGVICTSIGSWYVTQSDIDMLKKENEMRRYENSQNGKRIEEMRVERERSFEKLRDEMNRWFIILNDKLDRKADK